MICKWILSAVDLILYMFYSCFNGARYSVNTVNILSVFLCETICSGNW